MQWLGFGLPIIKLMRIFVHVIVTLLAFDLSPIIAVSLLWIWIFKPHYVGILANKTENLMLASSSFEKRCASNTYIGTITDSLF
jgi:hypothetical protein